jgi:hypothetical protein
LIQPEILFLGLGAMMPCLPLGHTIKAPLLQSHAKNRGGEWDRKFIDIILRCVL